MYANPVLIAAAVIPAIFLLVKVEQLDRLEKESKGLLLSLVVLGVVSTSIALVCEKLGMAILGALFRQDSVIYNVLLYFLVVGGSEEGAKYILLKMRTWKNPEFNCQFDGVVYGVFVSLGFALWENIGYVAMYGFSTAVVRAVTAVPGHACFGVFMGAFYGMAKRCANAGNTDAAKRGRRLSFLIPAIIHGLYDYIASIERANLGWVFSVFIALLFLYSVRLAKRMSASDRYIDGNIFRFM